MTLKERRERKIEAFRIGMERDKEESRELEAVGDTFMLGLMAIKEKGLTPEEVFGRQVKLIFGHHAKAMMAKTGTCPCCHRPAPNSKSPVASPQDAQ